jgi:membrane protein
VAADVVPNHLHLLKSIYWPAVLLLSVVFLTTLYHLALPVRRRWRVGLPGAVFTLTLWVFGSYFLRWVLSLSTGGTSIYGPLAAPIAVLLWLYVLSIAVLIGAALNAAFDEDVSGDQVVVAAD